MAYTIQPRLIEQRFNAILNACRWCGEKGEVQRNESSYRMEEEVRATCPSVCHPIYLERTINRGEPMEKYFGSLFAGLKALADCWNGENDGPAFMAGLA